MNTASIMQRIEAAPRLYARIVGLEYVFVIIGGAFAEVFARGRLFVHGDAASTNFPALQYFHLSFVYTGR